MIRPLGSHLYVRLLEAPELTAGGLFLPDEARTQPFDGEVVASGPGERLPSGATYPMQAKAGDRVVFERCDWVPLKDYSGFVPDSRIVALIPGPEQNCVLPANDYVFVLPDKKEALSEGGVLVASHSLGGQDVTAKRRGDELHAEFVQLEQTERWCSAPTEYERHRVCWDYLDHLTAWERDALGEAIKRGGRASSWRHYISGVKAPEVRSGIVYALGPGRVTREGYRDRSEPSFYVSPENSQTWLGVKSGDRVWFDREYTGVSICDGHRSLLAVRARFIAAVEA